MKFLYMFVLFILFVLLLIIYFINLVYLSSTTMFLFSRDSSVSLPVGLLFFLILGVLFGVFLVLLIQSFIKSKPKDIFDGDDF